MAGLVAHFRDPASDILKHLAELRIGFREHTHTHTPSEISYTTLINTHTVEYTHTSLFVKYTLQTQHFLRCVLALGEALAS
jgi:hypothetical protein